MTIPGINLNTIHPSNMPNNDIAMAMLKKTLDMVDVSGAATTKMMEQSVNPSVGKNFDFSV